MKIACQWWSGESDDPSSPPCSPRTAQSPALQQKIRSNAPSPSPIPSIHAAAAAASQVHSFKAEASDDMDMDMSFQPQAFVVGVVDVSEADISISSGCSNFPYLSNSHGRNLSNSDLCSTFRGSMSQMAAETVPPFQRHTVNNLSLQVTGSWDTVQQEPKARAQQKILSLQSEAQALLQMAMKFSKLSETRLEDDQSLLFDSVQLAASLAEKMTLAVNKARAAESIIWSLVSLTTSTHETQGLQQQAEDAQQLSQEMLENQRHIHRQRQHLGAMVPQSSSTPQRTLPAQIAAAVRPQVQRQNQIRLQPVARIQPISIDPGQEAFMQVHSATKHGPQSLGQATQTRGPQQQSQAKYFSQRSTPWHHSDSTDGQPHSQQRFLQTWYGSQPVVYPQQPRPEAMSSPPQRAAVSGKLLTAQVCLSDCRCPYPGPHPARGQAEAHQGAAPFLRGGYSGDDGIPSPAARKVNENGSEDIQRFTNVAGSVHASRSERQASSSVNSSTAVAAEHQRTLANAPSLQATPSSPSRRRDSIIERLSEAELNVVVLRNGMDAHTLTQEEKRELAQNDLNNWREQQRGRLRATSHPNALPSSSSVNARQNDDQNSDPGRAHKDPGVGTMETSPEQTRINTPGTDFRNAHAGEVKRPTFAQEQQILAQARQQSINSRVQQLLRHQISRHNTQLSSLRQTFVGSAGGNVPGHQEHTQTPQHDSPHIMALRPHSRASASHTNFAEIVDEVTREVLAPGPGRCGITGV